MPNHEEPSTSSATTVPQASGTTTPGSSNAVEGITVHNGETLKSALAPNGETLNSALIDNGVTPNGALVGNHTTVTASSTAKTSRKDYEKSIYSSTSMESIFHVEEIQTRSKSHSTTPVVQTMVEPPPYQGKPPGDYTPGSDWRIWLKRLENFMRLRKVTDDSKKFIFLDEIGDVNYAILEGLLPGKELEEYSYEELKAALTARYQRKVLVMSERFKLTQLTQKSGQNLAEFLNELQCAARSCEFDKISDVRDAFVSLSFISGVQSNDTRQKLIEQTGKDSSQLLALAEAHERAGQGAKELHRTGKEPVHAIHGRTGEYPHQRTRNDSSKGHNQKERQRTQNQRQKFCHICKLNGHSTEDCRYNRLNDESANAVSEDEASLYQYDDDHIQLHVVNLMSYKAPPKCLIETMIGTTPIEFELDTGSGVSVIGSQTWEALGRPSLQDTHKTARAYGEELLRFRGVLQTEVRWGSKKILTRLFVLNKSSSSIWGREPINAFDMDLGPVYRNGIQRAAEVKGV